MELKKYITIFWERRKIFFFSVFACVALAIIWQQNEPERFEATLLLNIGRLGVEESGEYYAYDSFYRLQADERFADTVVRWLGSPRIVEDIYKEMGRSAEKFSSRDLKSVFLSKRLSSQMIEVTFFGESKENVREMASASIVVLNRYTESLNREEKVKNWFFILGGEPIIREARVGFLLVFFASLCLGVFISFWATLFKWYLESKEREEQGG
ncbi:MAG: hypothetical protein HYV45_00030 [Candidatus Moranbacteria bacterium]|nr:hypothetical protein [Candidatus Moranbacteria bacterium]